MAANIKLKRSAVGGRTPTDLEYGELALNYADGILYYKSSTNSIESISGGGATLDSDAPADARAGDLWWDPINGKLKVWYDDGDPGDVVSTYSFTSNAVDALNYQITGTDALNNSYSGTNDPTIYVFVGDTIEITNNSSSSHPIYITDTSGAYDVNNEVAGVTNQGANSGQTLSWTTTSPGTYYYVCQFHPDMEGQIIVLATSSYSGQWVDAFPQGVIGYTGSAGNILYSLTAPSNPTGGTIWYDMTTGKSYFYYDTQNGAHWVLFSDPTVSDGDTGYTGSVGYTGSRGSTSPRNLSIVNPTTNDEKTVLYTSDAITLSSVRSVVVGSNTPSVTYTIKYATSRAAAGTTVCSETVGNTTTGSSPVIQNASIPAGNYVWVELSNVSGTVTEFATNLIF